LTKVKNMTKKPDHLATEQVQFLDVHGISCYLRFDNLATFRLKRCEKRHSKKVKKITCSWTESTKSTKLVRVALLLRNSIFKSSLMLDPIQLKSQNSKFNFKTLVTAKYMYVIDCRNTIKMCYFSFYYNYNQSLKPSFTLTHLPTKSSSVVNH
jgi:hypothetical protein